MSIETRVNQTDTGFDGECSCGFTSKGWPSAELAALRIDEHKAEHDSAGQYNEDTGEKLPAVPMREIGEFRAEHAAELPAG